MRLLNNQILVEPIYRDRIGNIFIPDNSKEAKMYTTTTGIVKKMPDVASYDKDNPNSLHVKLPYEVQEGDMVWFHFTCEYDAQQEGRYIGDDFLVNYRDIYVAKRRGHIIPLNGFVLAEPIITDFASVFPALKATGFTFTDKFIDGNDPRNRCIVKYMGKLVPEYKWGINDDAIAPDDPSIQIGDELLLTPFIGNELEKLEQTLESGKAFYRFQRRDVVGKIINGKLESVSDRLLVKAESVSDKIGSIYIPDISKEKVDGTDGRWGQVINTGYFVKERDARIYFNQWKALKINFDGEQYFSVRQRHILGTDNNGLKPKAWA